MDSTFKNFHVSLRFAVEFVKIVFKLIAAGFMLIYRWCKPLQKSLKKETVLITVASDVLGRDLAVEFCKRGAKVVLWDISKSACHKVEDEIKLLGGYCRSYICDVSKHEQVQSVARDTIHDVGEITMLINNSICLTGLELMDLDDKIVKKSIRINLLPYFWTLKEFLPRMIEKNSGHIVNISSIAGNLNAPFVSEYCAAKFAIYGLTCALAEELHLEKKNIFTTVVLPFYMKVELPFQLRPRFPKLVSISDPKEIAIKIVEGIARNEKEIYVPNSIAVPTFVSQVLPTKSVDQVIDFLEVFPNAEPQRFKYPPPVPVR